MQMIYNAIPTSDVNALGFHKLVQGEFVSTSWADLVSYFLVKAENRYGERDSRWFFSGIAFAEGGPNTYYPANRLFHVGIELSTSAAKDPYQAYFQLAHEVAHLLGPDQTRPMWSNYLEEGMCTSFQIEMSRAAGIDNFGDLGTYQEALELVERLHSIDADAIKKLREQHPNLRDIDAEKMTKILSDVPKELADQLVRQFPRR